MKNHFLNSKSTKESFFELVKYLAERQIISVVGLYYVYVLQSNKDNKKYTGYTKNLNNK